MPSEINTTSTIDLQGITSLFMTRWIYPKEETAEVIFHIRGDRDSPIAVCIKTEKRELFTTKKAYFTVSKKVDWFHEYGRDYLDPEHRVGMMIRADVIKKAIKFGMSSTLAIFVESEQMFYGMSALKYWNYVKTFGRVKESPYEPTVIDTACPKAFWKPLWYNNKYEIASQP